MHFTSYIWCFFASWFYLTTYITLRFIFLCFSASSKCFAALSFLPSLLYSAVCRVSFATSYYSDTWAVLHILLSMPAGRTWIIRIKRNWTEAAIKKTWQRKGKEFQSQLRWEDRKYNREEESCGSMGIDSSSDNHPHWEARHSVPHSSMSTLTFNLSIHQLWGRMSFYAPNETESYSHCS